MMKAVDNHIGVLESGNRLHRARPQLQEEVLPGSADGRPGVGRPFQASNRRLGSRSVVGLR